MDSNKMNLFEVLSKYNKVLIPEIQRDYVMGSGKEKLESLFSSMNMSLKEKKEFSFSCIVGYEDKINNCLYVYDGQQRLATLVFLCSYLCKEDTQAHLYEKFTFIGRTRANEFMVKPANIKKEDVVDFTTYSLLELRDKFSKHNLSKENGVLDFLLKNVYFDMVLVEKVSDAEQFFLDINDGLDLKEYEIYKAALFHHANYIMGNSFKQFALKMENEWLNFFSRYAKSERTNSYKIIVPNVCAEEVLIFYLKYCFRMMWIENNGKDEQYLEKDVTWLAKEHFERVIKITDAIIKIFSEKTPNLDDNIIINYSTQFPICPSGEHWNITFKNYLYMLHQFFNNIWKSEETKKDIIVWCYISNLPYYNESTIDSYLRMIRTILNYNRVENEQAKIYFGDWGVINKQIYYSRYCVKGIPSYYLKYEQKIDLSEYWKLADEIIKNNSKNILWKNWETQNLALRGIIDKEILIRDSSEYCTIKEIEEYPFINGIVDNFVEFNYGKQTCSLKNTSVIRQLKEIDLLNYNGYMYRKILNFLRENKLDIKEFMFEVNVSWVMYTNKETSQRKVRVIAHTWCDLFTMKDNTQRNLFVSNGNNFEHLYFYEIPDGWFDKNDILVQPSENIFTESVRKGFAAYGRISNIFSINSFKENFSYIYMDSNNNIIIDRKVVEALPEYLCRYNSDNWVFNKIKNQIVYFSEKSWLNDILIRLYYEIHKDNLDKNDFLKKDGYLYFVNIQGENYFFKMHSVE